MNYYRMKKHCIKSAQTFDSFGKFQQTRENVKYWSDPLGYKVKQHTTNCVNYDQVQFFVHI